MPSSWSMGRKHACMHSCRPRPLPPPPPPPPPFRDDSQIPLDSPESDDEDEPVGKVHWPTPEKPGLLGTPGGLAYYQSYYPGMPTGAGWEGVSPSVPSHRHTKSFSSEQIFQQLQQRPPSASQVWVGRAGKGRGGRGRGGGRMNSSQGAV